MLIWGWNNMCMTGQVMAMDDNVSWWFTRQVSFEISEFSGWKGCIKKIFYKQIKRGSGEHIILPWRMCNMHSAAFVLLKIDVVCYLCSKFQYILGPDCLIYSFRFCVHHFVSRNSRARVANFLYAHLSCDIQGTFCNLSLVRIWWASLCSC